MARCDRHRRIPVGNAQGREAAGREALRRPGRLAGAARGGRGGGRHGHDLRREFLRHFRPRGTARIPPARAGAAHHRGGRALGGGAGGEVLLCPGGGDQHGFTQPPGRARHGGAVSLQLFSEALIFQGSSLC